MARSAKLKDPKPDQWPAPNPRVQAAIEAAAAGHEARPARAAVRWEGKAPKLKLAAPHSDDAGFYAMLSDAFGTRSADALNAGLGKLDAVSRDRGTGRTEDATALNASLAFMGAIAPRDELEAALAMQMAGCHVLAMEMLGKARHTDGFVHLQASGILFHDLVFRRFTS